MITVKIEGTKEIAAEFERMKNAASDKVVGPIVRQESKRIVASARARIPVGSGLLRSQVGFINRNNARFPTKALIGINYRGEGKKRGTSAYYGHIVEYGGKTINRQARPFMKPAFDMHADNVAKAIIERVTEKLNIKQKK